MPTPSSIPISRRSFLTGSTALATAGLLPSFASRTASAAAAREFRLRCEPAQARFTPGPSVATRIWSYNRVLPGPEIRVKQGERLRIVLDNGLEQNTTLHCHGIRLPNEMDGVPHVTQEPIAPGDRFVYEFDAVDAGTFWYHPHERSSEQVGRGLSGPLIVEEQEPLRVDRELVWVLDDWRLDRSNQIAGNFGNMHDATHAGRIGNRVTINGRKPEDIAVRKGERIRLRVVNAANARIFGLDFEGHEPVVIALDGQPVTPHQPDGLLVLGPGMRADVILDMVQTAGNRFAIRDRYFERFAYDLVNFAYDSETLRGTAPDWPLELPANPLAEPDLKNAERHEFVFNGGMMGGMVMEEMGEGMISPRVMMDMMRSGSVWFINGIAYRGGAHEPLLTLAQGKSHVLSMVNATAMDHPMHLHGHSFRVISRNGEPTQHREWQDTVLMQPRERVEVALVADNPGDWMFHCHILEHQASGMMGVIRVA